MKLADTYPKVFDMVLRNLNVQEIMKAINNSNRKKILDILEKSKKQLNIREIAQKLPISYKSTYNNIQVLEEVGLVKLKKNPQASGQAVIVEYIGIKKVLDKIKK